MRFLPVAVALAVAVPAVAQSPPPLTPEEVAAWRDDLRTLERELPRRHVNVFHTVSRERWTGAIAKLNANLPSLARHEAIVGLMGVVALIRDGHTAVNPFFSPTGFRRYPIRLYAFNDGVYVRSADSSLADLVGARVVRIGEVPALGAMDSVTRVISHENEWLARRLGADFLGIPEILHAFDILPDMERGRLELERDGRRWTVTLAPVPLPPHGHGEADPSDPWLDAAPSGPERPLWLRRPGHPYWFEYDAGTGTLYIAYRQVVSLDHEPNAEFFRRAFAQVDAVHPKRVVLDIRDNSGGDNTYNPALVREIIRRPTIDRPDRLFVIIGGRTYSAAQNLVNALDRFTNATFVGEPTGSPINMYGDVSILPLENTGLAVSYSESYYSENPADRRTAFTPDLYTPITAAEYSTGYDPAMAAILAPPPPLHHQLGPAIQAGDSAAIDGALAAVRVDSLNRFRNVEGDVNGLGYELLGANQTERAILVFAANARAYPRSANVYDSLGEALFRAGRHKEAITSFRRALEIDPEFPPSRDWLRRLGVPN